MEPAEVEDPILMLIDLADRDWVRAWFGWERGIARG